MDDQKFFAIALEEAKKGFSVGGLPVRQSSIISRRDTDYVPDRRMSRIEGRNDPWQRV